MAMMQISELPEDEQPFWLEVERPQRVLAGEPEEPPECP